MADVTVTAASVVASDDAVRKTGTAGETITAGQPLYLDAATGKLKKCINTGSSEAAAVGIALHGASLNQPVQYVSDDPEFTVGGTVAAGSIYCVSGTAGGIAPSADLASADYATVLGVGISTSKIKLKINASGVAVP